MAEWRERWQPGTAVAGWTFSDAFDDPPTSRRCTLNIGAPDDPGVCYECGLSLDGVHPAPVSVPQEG